MSERDFKRTPLKFLMFMRFTLDKMSADKHKNCGFLGHQKFDVRIDQRLKLDTRELSSHFFGATAFAKVIELCPENVDA